MASNANRPSFEEVYGAYKASKTPSRPSFEEVYSSYQAGRGNAQQQQINNSYAALGVNSTAQAAIEDYRKRIEGYDWIGEGDYYYDAFSETDQARKAAGEIPEYLYKKYDFDDPDDVVLYGLGLPPKSLIRTIADKADKAKEKAEKEADYEQYRAQIEDAKNRSIFKGVNVPAAIQEITKGKTPTVQSETAPVSVQDAVFGDVPYTPDKKIEPLTSINKAENGWFGGIGDTITELRNTKAEDMAEKVAATYEQSARNDARFVDLEKALDTSEYDAYMRGELDELSPEGLAAHDIKEQIQGYKRNPGKGKDLSFVTDDEWAVYAHLYKTDSILTAQKYLDSIYARAAQRSAEDEAQRFNGGIVDKVIQTLSAGFDNAIKGAQRLVSDDFVAQTDAPTVQAYQQARSEEEGVAALVSDALFAIGNMTPSMITGGLAGTTAGAVAMGASAAGNAYNTEIKNGKTHEQAMLYGALVGVAESLTSKFLGGVEGISKNLLGKLGYKGASNLLGKVIKNPAVVGAIGNVLGRVASAASEGAEEYLQDAIIDPILRNIALGEENTINLNDENAWNSFLVGAITGGLLGGGNADADASIDTEATTNTPTAETPAQAQTEAPVEQTYKPEPVDTRILAGDTVILKDGSQVVVQDVDFDPINNMEMYLVEHNGQTEIVNSLNVTAQTIPETANTSNLKLGVNNQSHVTFDKMQQRQLDVLDSLAKKGGVPVVVVDRIDVGSQRAAANGSYDPKTGTIFVAADAIEGAYLYTGMHELTHHIKNFNAQGYTALENLVVDFLKTSDTYGADVLEGRINELVNKGFTREAALEEIVADSIPAVLTDQKTVEKLVRQNRPVAERIRDFLYQFWRSIKTTMDKLTGMHGRKEIAALRDNEKGVRKLYNEFDKALKGAGKGQPTATGGEMYSPKRPYSRNAPSDSIDNYTPETYDKYGWAYVNHVLNTEESADFFAKLSDIKNGAEINRTFDGKYIVAVGVKSGDMEGVKNVLVFTDGNYRSPSVDRVIRINLYDETSIEIVREGIYEIERSSRTTDEIIEDYFAPGIVNAYSEGVFPNYRQLRTGNGSRNPGSSGSEIDSNRRVQQDRGGNVRKAGQSVKASTKSRTYDEALAEYGAIPKGANPARDVDVPQRMDDTTKVRQHVRTIMETGDVTEEMVEMLKNKIEQGDLSYTPQSNKAVLAKVDKDIENSYATAYREWERTANGQLTPTAERIAKGERLLQIAAKKNDAETILELTSQLAMVGTEAGRNLQAFSMLKKLGPIGEVYYLNKVARDINNNMSEKAKARYGEVKLSPGLVEEVVNAKTKAERAAAYNALVRDVASQVPSTWGDKLKAWRYMAMLTNPKTHIRNFLGNALFAPAVKMKNIIGTGLERAFLRGEGAGKRTKSLGAKKKYKDFAAQDFENVEKTLKSSGKYNVSNEIEDQRTIFGNKYKVAKPLEAVRKFNSNLLESEDAVFLKHHYKAALAQYLQAKKADLSKYTEGSKLLEDARAYAMQEALKATYRDASALTTYLTQGVHTSNKGFNIVANAFIEGALPFKKTPVNIMRRGVEYSPLGLVKTISADLVRLKKGSIDAPTFIDNLASGLTGSGLFAVGMYLAAQGLATGGMDKKDPEDRMKLLTGEQAYAIQIGDFSYTVDWLAPLSVPFFLGVETWSAITEDKDITFATLMDSAKLALEPLFELSMLQGVSSLIETAGYDDNSVIALLGKMAQNYASQFLPSLGGAIARIADPVTRKGYVDKNEGWPTDISSFYQQAIGKIPGLSALRQPALNAWGEEEVTDDILMRMFENLVSPGYYSKIEVSPVEREIMRLFNAEDTTGVLPSEADKHFQVNGERYDMTGEEYTAYATFRGETAYGLAKALTKNVMYKDLVTDEIRAKCIAKAFDYANQVAKQTIVPEYDVDKWVGEMSKLKTPEEMADYIIDAVITGDKSYEADVLGVGAEVYDEATDFFKHLSEDYEGREYSDFRKKQWLGYVNSIDGLTTEQRKWLYESKGNYSWNKRND